MADLTPYTYPDGTPADQLRYLRQLYAETLRAKSVTSPDGRSVTRHDPSQILAAIKKLEAEQDEPVRMHTVYARHGRR